jgi:hypothetical protein
MDIAVTSRCSGCPRSPRAIRAAAGPPCRPARLRRHELADPLPRRIRRRLAEPAFEVRNDASNGFFVFEARSRFLRCTRTRSRRPDRTARSPGTPRASSATACERLVVVGTRTRARACGSVEHGRMLHAARAFAMDRFGSGTTSSGSTSIVVPRPVHAGHAPCGLLNENMRGASSSKLIPQSTHAKCSLCSVSPFVLSGALRVDADDAAAEFQAVSTESVNARCTCRLSRRCGPRRRRCRA